MNDRFWELLAGYYTNKLGAEERIELERLLLEHPDNWLKTGLLQQIRWELQPGLTPEQADKIADRVLRIGKEREKGIWKRSKALHKIKGWKAAAMIAVFVCIGMVILLEFHEHRGKENSLWRQITTTDGMRSSIRLADGSEVWLNAGTTMRYPEDFNSKSREVYLTGEAYFKIKQDASRPFIVHTARMNIKVLGTEFDVKAYPDEAFSETSLIKGKVEVIVKNGNDYQTIFLKPDQKLRVNNRTVMTSNTGTAIDNHQIKPLLLHDTVSSEVVLQSLKILNDHIIPETAWKENMLIFEDESLASLARRLDRWYGVNITIADTTLAQQRFTGRADNVSLDKLLQILQMIKPFKYSINDKEVVIK